MWLFILICQSLIVSFLFGGTRIHLNLLFNLLCVRARRFRDFKVGLKTDYKQPACSPPELPQGLAELRVVQVRVLVGQFPPRRLRPHHEGVHWPLHVLFVLVSAAYANGHGHEGPVVALEHLAHSVADSRGEAVVLVVGFDGGATRRRVVQPDQLRLMLLPVERRVPSNSGPGGMTR